MKVKAFISGAPLGGFQTYPDRYGFASGTDNNSSAATCVASGTLIGSNTYVYSYVRYDFLTAAQGRTGSNFGIWLVIEGAGIEVGNESYLLSFFEKAFTGFQQYSVFSKAGGQFTYNLDSFSEQGNIINAILERVVNNFENDDIRLTSNRSVALIGNFGGAKSKALIDSERNEGGRTAQHGPSPIVPLQKDNSNSSSEGTISEEELEARTAEMHRKRMREDKRRQRRKKLVYGSTLVLFLAFIGFGGYSFQEEIIDFYEQQLSSPIEDADKPEIKDPDIDKPEVKAPVEDNPEVKAPVVDEPDFKDPDIDKPEVKARVLDKPTVKAQVVDKPEVKAQVADKPEIKDPDIDKPEVKAPVVGKPEVKVPVVGEPEVKSPILDEAGVKGPVVEEPAIKGPTAKQSVASIKPVYVIGEGKILTFRKSQNGIYEYSLNVELFLKQYQYIKSYNDFMDKLIAFLDEKKYFEIPEFSKENFHMKISKIEGNYKKVNDLIKIIKKVTNNGASYAYTGRDSNISTDLLDLINKKNIKVLSLSKAHLKQK